MSAETLTPEEALEYGIEPEPDTTPVAVHSAPAASPSRTFRTAATPPPADRPLPSCPESEKGVLSSAMLEPSVIDALSEITPDYFHRPAHATVWGVLQEMRAAGRQMDFESITREIHRRNLIEQIGGQGELQNLRDCLLTGLEYRLYSDEVVEKYQAREGIRITEQLTRSLYEGQGRDPSELIAEYTTKMEGLKTTPKESDNLTFRTISEILKMEFSDDDLYLRNGYLQRGGSLSIFGAGGIGKSRLAMQLAICSAAGLPFLGWETQGKPKWLFLQTENGNRRLSHDLKKMTSLCDERDLAKLDEKIVFHTIENRFDRLLRPSNPKSASRMEKAIRHHNPDVVVIDVLRDFAIGDINSDEGMTDTLDAIEQIVRADRPDRAIVIVHHARTGKAASAGAYGMDRANFGRNSKVLLGWSRAVLNVAQLSETDEHLIGVASGKNNDFREIEPIAIRLNPDHMIYIVDKDIDVSEQIAALTETKKAEPKVTVSDVLAIVEARHPAGISKVDIAKELTKSKRVSNATAYRVIGEAETQKSIKFSGKLRGFFSPSKTSDEKA